jgi:GxxExxY protein
MNKIEQDKIALEIIRCAREVYTILGHGYQEVVYQRALAIEMKLKYIDFRREFKTPLYYKGVDVGQKRVDFLVENEIPVEINAFHNLADAHLTQAISYLESYNLETALIINFGSEGLDFKRLYNPKYK